MARQAKTAQPRAPKMGSKVTDKVTGFTGYVTCIATYITGSTRCEVTPSASGPTQELPRSEFFDVARLERVK